MVRQQHPGDGASVFTLHEAVAAALRSPVYSPEPLILLHGVGNSGAIYGPILGGFGRLGPVMAPTMSPELLSITERLMEAFPAGVVEAFGGSRSR